MVPTYINDCFAILHPAQGTRGALICGALSDEALNSHRALVFLGEQLAGAGMPALRLAYYGTGDSAGSDEEPNRFAQWLDSIAAGAAWLQAECGVTAVTLFGHRIGASLAARAACDLESVDSLVLSCPISGRQFLHELTLTGRLAQRVWKTSHKLDDGTWFESHGLRIDHSARDGLMQLDARKLTSSPASDVLVMDANNRPASKALAGALRQSGANVTFEDYDRLEAMQRDSFEVEVPHPAFASTVDWMRSLPSRPGTPRPPRITNTLTLAAGHEMPVQFGPDEALFGVLSLPRRPASSRMAVLLVNTTANPRWGNARIAVDVARALAQDGVATLRMDSSGMGDAAPGSGERGRPYSEPVTAEVAAAAAELAERSGQPVAVMGFCSGAYHALQAALREPIVQGLILVNLQHFTWRDGDPVVQHTTLRPNAFYLRNMFRAEAWYRLIRADFDVANLLRVFSARLLRRAIAAVDPMLGGRLTRVGQVRRWMRALGARNVQILYVLGCNDPGTEELAECFGRDGWRLRRQPNVTYRMLQDADHTLSAWPVRMALIDEIRGWSRSARSEARAPKVAIARSRPAQMVAAK